MEQYRFLTPTVSKFPFGLKPYCLNQTEATMKGMENFNRCFGYISGLSRQEAYAVKRLLNSCLEYNCINARVGKCKHGGDWMVSFDYTTERKPAPGRKFYINGELTEYKDWRNLIAAAGGLAQWDRFDCQMGDTSEDFEWSRFKAVKF